jgi:DUF4097 and DUF4098 domain-containing protein YvlB
MERSFEVEGPVTAEVELPAGRVEVALVEGFTNAEVSITPLGGREEKAERLIAKTRVELRGDHLYVVVPHQRLTTEELLVSLRLPVRSSLEAKTASAGVLVTGGRLAALSVRSASGDTAAGDVEGSVSYQAASGGLECGRVGGDLEASTASGSVRVAAVAGSLRGKSASGNLVLGELGSELSFRTASGNLDVRMASSGTVNASSVSGDVTIGLAAGRGAWLDLTTVSGKTTCELAGEQQSESAADVRLICRSVSGNVRIHPARLASEPAA